MSISDTQPQHYRRNAACLIGDYVWFGVGMSFISSATVLPSFVRQLTDSTILIGLVTAIQAGGWLLPQILAARWIRGRTRVKRFIVIPSMIGRPTFWITAIIISLFGVRSPGLALAVFYLGFLLFSAADGVASVPWFDLFAKAIPIAQRGRTIGTAQVIYGIVALGVSGTIAYLLGPTSALGFPNNYALLFFLSGIAFMLSLLAIARIHEPEGTVSSPDSPRSGYLRLLWRILSRDRGFVTLVSTHILVGYSAMAYPFYVIYATEVLGMSAQTIGVFVLVQTAGGILGGVVLGYLNEKRGSAAVVVAHIGISLALPLTGFTVHSLSGGVSHSILTYVYMFVFLIMGLANSSMMLGFIPRYLEIAPETERPVYIGLANTLNALTLLAPLLGGWILQEGSYPMLFIAAACCAALALLLRPRAAGHGRSA
ncbi:MAG: MFS transporter [Anaerolineae bacterium]|nr:MFS transporter [Anaerolineae bacterium]